jgi:membrane protease YdiL (CAAX protease family)
MTSLDNNSRAWTYGGLAVALFALPAVMLVFRLAGYSRADSGAVVVRELAVLALVALLLWIVRFGERLQFSSIGFRRQPVGWAVLWTLAVMAAFAAALFLCLGVVLPALGLKYGSGGGPAASLLVTALVVARAGLAEEIFYRGYAIERIQALTGNRAVAALVPLIMFASFHFSQGIAGILVALFVGAVATTVYLWKRNLVILIAAHFLLDFIPNVLLPLVSEG